MTAQLDQPITAPTPGRLTMPREAIDRPAWRLVKPPGSLRISSDEPHLQVILKYVNEHPSPTEPGYNSWLAGLALAVSYAHDYSCYGLSLLKLLDRLIALGFTHVEDGIRLSGHPVSRSSAHQKAAEQAQEKCRSEIASCSLARTSCSKRTEKIISGIKVKIPRTPLTAIRDGYTVMLAALAVPVLELFQTCLSTIDQSVRWQAMEDGRDGQEVGPDFFIDHLRSLLAQIGEKFEDFDEDYIASLERSA